ncbi:hypothetical protein Droror1_Dr00006161, partial [Drosera rotundifolia]
MNLYKHVDGNKIVHVYATVDTQVDVLHNGPSTSHWVLRRSPRKQQRISQLQGEEGIQIYTQIDVQHSGSSTSHGVLRRSPRKQQRISQLQGEG